MKNPIKLHKQSASGAAPTAVVPTAVLPAPPASAPAQPVSEETINLEQRRNQLATRVAELQWDLGGLVYEMAMRDALKPAVIVERAAVLQRADAELGEVERILRLEKTGVAAFCHTCGAPHSSGAVYCWQCGGGLLEHVAGETIASHS